MSIDGVSLTTVGAGSKGNVSQRVLAAAAACAARVGIDNVMVDDVIRESGVPRTTIYRKFGSRDAILRAMIIDQAEPYLRELKQIAASSRSFRDRMESILVVSIGSLANYGWAQSILDHGPSHASLSLFEGVYRDNHDGGLNALMVTAEAAGQLRTGLTIPRLMPWLVRQIIELGCSLRGDMVAIREAVRLYIMPVLTPDSANPDEERSALSARLDRIEALIERIDQRLPESLTIARAPT